MDNLQPLTFDLVIQKILNAYPDFKENQKRENFTAHINHIGEIDSYSRYTIIIKNLTQNKKPASPKDFNNDLEIDSKFLMNELKPFIRDFLDRFKSANEKYILIDELLKVLCDEWKISLDKLAC